MNKIEDIYELGGSADRILVTCALPYVNNVPHLGNLVPIVSADVYSRYLQLKGIPSVYICATDEHGTRTEIEAKKAGLDEDTYCAQIHEQMLEIFGWFNVEFTHFGRTSCSENHEITQGIFRSADKNGFILEEEIRQLYCQTCEHYLPDTYVEGTCPFCNTPGAKGDQCDACGRFLDPLELLSPRCKTCSSPPEVRATRHLFLKLDDLAPQISDWIKSNGHWDGIIRNMPLGWIAEGMRPRAITRDLKWGVSVPKEGFENKVFYVWFDAPIGYIAATAEWAKESGESLDDWWKNGKARLVHFLGKDNVPFHTIMWPGTLIAADDDWNLPDYIAANEYLNYEGGSFSKSRNRGVFSNDVMGMGFPADAIRFYLTANRPEKRDTDFTFAGLQTTINASLVGNFGNLANRLLSFIAKRFGEIPEPGKLGPAEQELLKAVEEKAVEVNAAFSRFELRAAARLILEMSDLGNVYLQNAAPWKTFKEDPEQCRTTLFVGTQVLHHLAKWTSPIMPERCDALLKMMGCDIETPPAAGNPVPKPKFLFKPVDDDRIQELHDQYKGAGEEAIAPLEFHKEPGVEWPCVILELTDLEIRRRVNAVERWKQKKFSEIDVDAVAESERVAGYREGLAQRDRGERTISVQNLVNIARREGKLPNINTLVDIYNHFSLSNGLVMGAYERRTIHGKLIYAVATGDEQFVPVKGEKPEAIHPGEWVLKDETDMVVTKVTTKQSEAAAVTTQTTACAMCIQGNPTTDLEFLQKVAQELAETIVSQCGGQFRIVFAG